MNLKSESSAPKPESSALQIRSLFPEIAADLILSHPAFSPGSCSTIDECHTRESLIAEILDKEHWLRDWVQEPFNPVHELLMTMTVETVFWERQGMYGWAPDLSKRSLKQHRDQEFWL
jgi:hypothetical protein